MTSSTCTPSTPLTLGLPVESLVINTKRQPSKGHAMNPSDSNTFRSSLYHRYGASTLPYAPPLRRHWSPPCRPRAFPSSLGACIPNGRPSPWPFKKAVDISKLSKLHPLLATSCSRSWRPSLDRASLGTSDKPGSSKPSTTNRALARHSTPPTSGAFQVRIQRHRMICSGFKVPLVTFWTVPWSIHALISFCFAASNNFWSSLLRCRYCTSTICFLALLAIRTCSANNVWIGSWSFSWGISSHALKDSVASLISQTPASCSGSMRSSPKAHNPSSSSDPQSGTGTSCGSTFSASTSFSPVVVVVGFSDGTDSGGNISMSGCDWSMGVSGGVSPTDGEYPSDSTSMGTSFPKSTKPLPCGFSSTTSPWLFRGKPVILT